MLGLVLTIKEGVMSKTNLGALTVNYSLMNLNLQHPERRKEGKKQNHNTGLQERRL